MIAGSWVAMLSSKCWSVRTCLPPRPKRAGERSGTRAPRSLSRPALLTLGLIGLVAGLLLRLVPKAWYLVLVRLHFVFVHRDGGTGLLTPVLRRELEPTPV